MKLNYHKIPLFQNVSTKTVQYIDNNSIIESYHKHQFIHLEGDQATHFELIVSGHVHIEQTTLNGDVKIIQDYYQNEVIGMNILFSSAPYYLMNVVALKDTHLLRLPTVHLYKVLEDDAAFRMNYIRILSDNTKRMGAIVKSQFRQSLREKILQFLKQEHLIQQSNTVLLPSSKTRLAQQFGVARTSLQRELQKMAKDKLIAYTKNEITLLNNIK